MVDGQGSGVQFGWLVPKPQARLPSGVHLQRGEGLQGVEGPRGDGGDLVVIEREEADAAQPREAVIVDAADAVVPQHPGSRERRGESVPCPAAICLPCALAASGQFTSSPLGALSHGEGSHSARILHTWAPLQAFPASELTASPSCPHSPHAEDHHPHPLGAQSLPNLGPHSISTPETFVKLKPGHVALQPKARSSL